MQAPTRSIAATLILLAAACGVSAQVRTLDRLVPVEQGVADLGPLRVSTRVLQSDLRVPSGFDRVYRVPGSAVGVGASMARFGVGLQPATGPRNSSDGGFFARVSGGLAAVFPASEYRRTPEGAIAQIPAGTVFYIGGLPSAPRREAFAVSPVTAAQRFDTSSSTLVAAQSATIDRAQEQSTGRPSQRLGPITSQAPAPLKPDAPPVEKRNAARKPELPSAHVLVDEQYRRKRIREVLLAAAATHP